MSEESDLAEVGPWAEQKLAALASYLNYYTTVLKNQVWCRTIYLDAFAGGGKASLRSVTKHPLVETPLWDDERPAEHTQIVVGSPRRALDLANPFDRYVFVDADPKRVSQLYHLQSEYEGRRRIDVRQGSAEDQITWLLKQNISKTTHRGVAFLDPFGAHLPWTSVQALAATRIFEAIINFPLHMCINRLATLNPAIPSNWRDQLDSFFGPGWYDEVYETTEGLFGAATRKRADATDRLLRFYRANLKNAFGHVSQPMLIRNTRGSPLYYIIWAGPHRKGLEGADYVLKTGERLQKRA
ncbi:three-Cys-motif partner protein TcmP [Brevundimonas albigilva]|uniref:Three-Cys-motif partner protein TcmP n=1 Tax=Brevundimonas albigilva TaxID=1312364 RepID=A0ABY4SJI6_9CAUL|nr:three-Cys-motif partner protein TcmP [Brevundimonas albigilva]UQV17127.1 three-Cys-motif partner protein TcmP [Brevundimonas albigilva]URI15132.1 three-Cys-motif partner protein TcmP [Brevundimonas albigilva]